MDRYDDNDDDDDDDASKSKYLLLVSNAMKEGKPEAFTNTLIDEIDGSKSNGKEIAFIDINLPTAWHSTTAVAVAGHAFVFHVDTATATTTSWINFRRGICATNKNMVVFTPNAILGSFPSDTSYDTVRDYIQKGILDPLNVYLDGVALPAGHENAQMTFVGSQSTLVYLEGAVNNGEGLAPNSYVINISFNEKTAAVMSLYPNNFTRNHTFWKDTMEFKQISSSTPRDETHWFQPNNYMQLYVDQPAKLHGETLSENDFQMFYIYMNILEARFVGNKQYRLLAAIPNPGKKDQQHSFSYNYTMNPPIYLPVEKRKHKNIEITVRDDQDRPIFFEWGVTSILVHLRKRYERV